MGDLADKEKKLADLEVEDEIESRRMTIAQKKAAIAEAKKTYGRDWRKILGIIRVDKEAMLTMFGPNPKLRELTKPGNRLNKL